MIPAASSAANSGRMPPEAFFILQSSSSPRARMRQRFIKPLVDAEDARRLPEYLLVPSHLPKYVGQAQSITVKSVTRCPLCRWLQRLNKPVNVPAIRHPFA